MESRPHADVSPCIYKRCNRVNLIVKAVLQVVSPALQDTQSVKSLPWKSCPSAVPWILPPHTTNFPPGSRDRLGPYLVFFVFFWFFFCLDHTLAQAGKGSGVNNCLVGTTRASAQKSPDLGESHRPSADLQHFDISLSRL